MYKVEYLYLLAIHIFSLYSSLFMIFFYSLFIKRFAVLLQVFKSFLYVVILFSICCLCCTRLSLPVYYVCLNLVYRVISIWRVEKGKPQSVLQRCFWFYCRQIHISYFCYGFWLVAHLVKMLWWDVREELFSTTLGKYIPPRHIPRKGHCHCTLSFLC